MNLSRSVLAGVLAAAIGIGLVGCATSPPESTQPPVAEPSPTPTPTPTPEPAGDPAPRTPLDCESLVDAGALADLIGAEPQLVDPPVAWIADLAALQAGLLQCSWRAPETTFTVVVAPQDLWDDPSQGWTPACTVGEGHAQCGTSRPAGDLMFEAMFVSFASGLDEVAVQDASDEVFDTMTDRIADAGVLPAWPAPEVATATFPDCSDLASEQIEEVLDPVSPAEHQGSGDGFSAVYQGWVATGFGDCTLQIPHPDHPLPITASFEVTWLAGGAWGFSSLGGEPITVDGADEAALVCDEHSCQVVARIGESIVSGAFGVRDFDDATAARYLVAIIPSLPIAPAP